jgi:site-specific recombinase XerD
MAPEGEPTALTRIFQAPRTNDQFVEAFRTYLVVLHLSSTVATEYPRNVKKFAASLDGRSLLDATRDDVRAFGASFSSVAMRHLAMLALRRFFDFLQAGGVTVRNPAREVLLPKRPQRIPRVPSVEEVARLLQAVEEVANGEKETQ